MVQSVCIMDETTSEWSRTMPHINVKVGGYIDLVLGDRISDLKVKAIRFEINPARGEVCQWIEVKGRIYE